MGTARRTTFTIFPALVAALLAAAALAVLAVLAMPAPAFASSAAGSADAGHSRASSVPLLVLVVGFNGGDSPESAVSYREDYNWGAHAFGPEDSVARYYTDMSGGAFTFVPAHETSAFGVDGNANAADVPDDGVVHVTLDSGHDGWATVNEDSSVTRDFCWKAMEMLEAAVPYVDFAAYDTDADGTLESDELAVVLCIAGYEASAMNSYRTTDLPVIWSHSGSVEIIGRTDRTLNGLQFGPYLAIAEQYWNDDTPLSTAVQQPVGMLCHELGHTLDLPDLYAIDDGTGVTTWGDYEVGGLSLMANGAMVRSSQGGAAQFWPPVAFDAWSRYELGWTEPVMVTESGDYPVCSQLSENGYTQLFVPTLDPDRYYLVENRQPEGYDEGFQSLFGGEGGIVVWQVDERICRQLNDANEVNSWSHHPGVMPLYYETAGGAYSMDWTASMPSTDEPFYSSGSWAARFGEGAAALELPAYSADPASDVPAARTNAGIRIGFPSESARDMTVHIELSEPLQSALQQDLLKEGVTAKLRAFFGGAA